MLSQRIARAIAAVALGLHVAVGIAALVLLPRGFPWNDIHAWSNTVMPAALAAVTIVSLVRYLRGATNGVAVLVAAAAGGWVAAVVTGGLLFPISMPLSRLLIPTAIALALTNVAWWARARIAMMLPAFVVGGALGHVVIRAQKAPPPSTRPSGGALAEVKGDNPPNESVGGQIEEPCGSGKNTIRIKPLLTFESRSPDATWTLLAPPGSFGARRKLERWEKTPTGFRAFYTDDGESTLVASHVVATAKSRGSFEIEAVTKLAHPVYSHLNSFTRIHFNFPAKLSFSPIEKEEFAIEPADYPSGRPLKLAYVGSDLELHVVRASDGEKGPFTELAHGRLTRDTALAIEIHPEKQADAKEGPSPMGGQAGHKKKDEDLGCKIVLRDWTAQISTDVSSTAGWGLTQNSIQFFLKDGETFVVLTLAETGPGRGWDSVAHAEGTYRNRLHTEDLR